MIRGYDSHKSNFLPLLKTAPVKKRHSHIYIYILILGFLDTCSIPWKYWNSVPAAGPGGWGLPLAHLGAVHGRSSPKSVPQFNNYPLHYPDCRHSLVASLLLLHIPIWSNLSVSNNKWAYSLIFKVSLLHLTVNFICPIKTSRFPAEFPMFAAPLNLSAADGALSPVAASVAGRADFWGANHPSKMSCFLTWNHLKSII